MPKRKFSCAAKFPLQVCWIELINTHLNAAQVKVPAEAVPLLPCIVPEASKQAASQKLHTGIKLQPEGVRCVTGLRPGVKTREVLSSLGNTLKGKRSDLMKLKDECHLFLDFFFLNMLQVAISVMLTRCTWEFD